MFAALAFRFSFLALSFSVTVGYSLRVGGAVSEVIDELLAFLLARFALFFLFPCELSGSGFSRLTFMLFLFAQLSSIRFVPLDVGLDESGVFALELYDTLFGLRDIYVVNEIISYSGNISTELQWSGHWLTNVFHFL